MEQSSEKTLIDFFWRVLNHFQLSGEFFPFFFSFFFKSSESMFHQQLFAAGETRRFSTSINQKFTQRNGAKSFLLMNEASKNAQIPFFFFFFSFKIGWDLNGFEASSRLFPLSFPECDKFMVDQNGHFFWTSAILEWMGRKFLEQFLPMKVTC